MSGLEVLAAVCSIFQVISFSQETITLCKKVYRTGSSVDRELIDNAAILSQLSSQTHELNTSIGNARSSDDQQLHDVLRRCQSASKDLQEEVYFINGHATRGSLASTLKIAVKTNWRKRRLENLEKRLCNVQKLMETGLLVRICNRVDFTQVKLDALDSDLRSFLIDYKAGHRTVSELVSTESLRTRHHISFEAIRLERSINSAVVQVNATVGSTMASLSKDIRELRLANKPEWRERLLRSLKFPGMNERRQQVSKSFSNTFEWAYGDENSDLEDDSTYTSKMKDCDKHAFRKYQISSRYGIHDTHWDNFDDWLRSTSSIYWISGKPGSGKTTLVKYLLSNPRTRAALDVWNAEAILLAHFFWRPGNLMQQSIKGLLCSLLHQLGQTSSSTLEMFTCQIPEAKYKDNYTDWDIGELKHIFIHIVHSLEKPTCIFIDGLDEVDPGDGIFELFEVIHMMTQTPSIKLCLSSRPEPPILKRLGSCPQLRMQDLTLGDLRMYAKGTLRLPRSCLEIGTEKSQDHVIGVLVKKAEGVFLWLCLAVKSLNAGFDNEDHLEDVLRRMKTLPQDLTRLYMDMWTRLNENNAVYCQSAALYFKLVIASLRVPWETRREAPACLTQSAITVLEMAIATTSPQIQFELGVPTVENLTNWCNETIRLVKTRGAGLLEIVESNHRQRHKTRQYHDEEFRPIIPFADGSFTIRFIHRTALDFLTNTLDGSAILNACTESKQSLYTKLYRGGLSTRYLFPSLGSHYSACLEMYTQELSRIWHMAELPRESALHTDLQGIAAFLEFSITSRTFYVLWGYRNHSRTLHKNEFLTYAAWFGLSSYIKESFSTREISQHVESDILLAISARVAYTVSAFQVDIELVEELLHRGVTLSYKGCVLCFPYFSASKGRWLFAGPLCAFLSLTLTARLQDATRLRIERLCHILTSLLNNKPRIADMVAVGFRALDSGDLEFVSVPRFASLLWTKEAMDYSKSVEEKAKKEHGDEGASEGNEDTEEEEDNTEEEDNDDREEEAWQCSLPSDPICRHYDVERQQLEHKYCCLLIPAFTFINALMDKFEEVLNKKETSKGNCCSLDCITAIRAEATPTNSVPQPQMIKGSHTEYGQTISGDEILGLSDVVIRLWVNPQSENAAVMLRDKYLDTCRRSEMSSLSLTAELKNRGFIWDFEEHQHGPHEDGGDSCSKCKHNV